jgi:hypothetical protein
MISLAGERANRYGPAITYSMAVDGRMTQGKNSQRPGSAALSVCMPIMADLV